MPMMHFNEIAALRTELRAVNMEFSALLRTPGIDAAAPRMAELKMRRGALMSRIAAAANATRTCALMPSLEAVERAA